MNELNSVFNLPQYEPNWFMEYLWYFYSYPNWAQNVIFIIVIVLQVLLHFKFIRHFNSGLVVFSPFILLIQWSSIALIVLSVACQFYVKNIIPYDTLQKLIWFQTSYPTYHKNQMFTECTLEYKEKLHLPNNMKNVRLFSNEIADCIRRKEGHFLSEFNQNALQLEREQNLQLLKNYNGQIVPSSNNNVNQAQDKVQQSQQNQQAQSKVQQKSQTSLQSKPNKVKTLQNDKNSKAASDGVSTTNANGAKQNVEKITP